MGRIKRPYGSWSQAMLEGMREAGALKVEALLTWLAEREILIDRTLISHWVGGRSHLPADLLPVLADFSGRPELVFGPYVREVGCEVVRLSAGAPQSRELTDAVLAAGAAVGRLQHAIIQARAPGSPGGEHITPEERRTLQRDLDVLIQQVVELRSRLSKDPGGDLPQ